ncbi:MAG: sulfite exporter TauE/SafE family protein [Promethearchaeota archaeon]
MALEIPLILLLILNGALVGISMSFVGQTGQGVVVPLILLISGDVLLAIVVNLLNDFIAAISVGFSYVRKRQFYFSKNILILLGISLIFSFLGVLILMVTPLSTIFGWVLPIFIIFLGITIISKGFPTSESLKETVSNISAKLFRRKREDVNAEDVEIYSEKSTLNEEIIDIHIKSIIKPYSKLFFILTSVLGIIVGLNSGLFGANSGFIITLVLIILFGYPLKKSIGTALLLSLIMSISTFIFYQILAFNIQGKLYFNWEYILYLGIGSFISGLTSSTFVQKLSARAMGRGMGITMIILGISSLIFYLIS